ncbi:ABC-2 family transporter protein [Sporobacter termitidis DSM 10068]|uniref:ABC-2 family transporter protein n=1 Tax=Sporobacter termitidis DSM 10068 TaxID=1123282 RepID=A0A1M5UGY7_9FIRM|nr:ABC-2 transporter permease [Sporobacter termitidis]SHH62190.1 ABC-2 family transporter protein [Sporobacter termitidis DSM 10068]
MKNLFYKEFKLAIPSVFLMFLLFGALLLIPSWPFFIAFGYIFIAFMNIFLVGRENQDIFFTATLPVPKRDAVRARIYAIAAMELAEVAVAVPFAMVNTLVISPLGNQIGMNPNFAFFGFVLMLYAIFNAIFLPMFYKTAHKVGTPILIALAAVLVYAVAVEAAVHTVPYLKTNINALGADHLSSQLVVLAAGIVLFVLMTLSSLKRSIKNFEKVDL